MLDGLLGNQMNSMRTMRKEFTLNGDRVRELMIITMEECGELTQASSKVIRTMMSEGEIPDHATEKLTQEVADVLCMIEIMQEYGLVKHDDIIEGIERKRDKLRKWSDLIPKRPTWQEILANEDE